MLVDFQGPDKFIFRLCPLSPRILSAPIRLRFPTQVRLGYALILQRISKS